MKSKPFIHLFETSEGKYLYDVNTDKILKIPEGVYHYLSLTGSDSDTQADLSILQYIENLKRDGYLSSNRVKETEHPATELLPFYINNRLNYITLQVTQNCNLRCEYCIYSGNYYNRSHSSKTMSKETATKAIEYYISHSRDAGSMAIGFYGGEPLLCMDLIKYCVEYADKNAEGREITYSFTTNGTLLTKDILPYLVEHKFVVRISLDGPGSIHDKNRRFANSNKGSYETIIKNIRCFKETYPSYYRTNVMFNTVLDPSTDFNCINEYVMSSEELEESSFNCTLIDDRYAKQASSYQEDFFTNQEYETFKYYLKKLNRLSNYKESKLVSNRFTLISKGRGGKQTSLSGRLPDKCHHGGPCIPGVMRLFISADGYLYPCERVSETSEVTSIGDVDSGIDIKKAENILNIERVTAQMCHNCWAYHYCYICIGLGDGLRNISPEIIKMRCPNVMQQAEDLFKNYCILSELGYEFMSKDEQAVGLINY